MLSVSCVAGGPDHHLRDVQDGVTPPRWPREEVRHGVIPAIMSFVSLDLYIKWEWNTAEPRGPLTFLLPVCIYISMQYVWIHVTLKSVSTEAAARLLDGRPSRSPHFQIPSNKQPKFGHIDQKKGRKKKSLFLSSSFLLTRVEIVESQFSVWFQCHLDWIKMFEKEKVVFLLWHLIQSS